MKPAPVLIKKYQNRRLYDSSNSQYVNLDDIAGFIREGKEVQIVDGKTGQDLTRVTLTQIITEDAKDKPTGLPTGVQGRLGEVQSAILSPVDMMKSFWARRRHRSQEPRPNRNRNSMHCASECPRRGGMPRGMPQLRQQR